MELRLSGFSQGLARDPTTRRIWFDITTEHDFKSLFLCKLEELYFLINSRGKTMAKARTRKKTKI
jgi:hypothetical protein